MNSILNHLWQSTAFAAMIALAALALRRNSPRVRYWLWLAASVKFLIPFSFLVSTGARVQLPPDRPQLRALTVNAVSAYFAPMPVLPATAPAKSAFNWPLALGAVWFGGALFLAGRRYRQWRSLRRVANGAKRVSGDYPIPMFSSESGIEPGVFGAFRPVLLVPEGLTDALTPAQFETILSHELNHVRYRDNLTAALHMGIETLFWFHPLVWWIGGKLIDERERDCDAAALARGGNAGDYARGILRVCDSYAGSPLACAAGIGGSDLKRRVREIMTWRGSMPVTMRGKTALAAAAALAVSIPFVIGVVRAQSLPPAPAYTYNVVSIKRVQSADDGLSWREGAERGIRIDHATAVEMILLAYGIPGYRLSGAPGWADSERYDVEWTPAEKEIAHQMTVNETELARRNRQWQRLQAILRDRFGLVLRMETREMPIYSLVRLPNAAPPVRTDGQPSSMHGRGGQLVAKSQPITRLATFLGGQLGKPVIDDTGLEGQYDFSLQWEPLDADANSASNGASSPMMGPSVTGALKDQLGLRLISKKGPVQVYVVEKIERPSEN